MVQVKEKPKGQTPVYTVRSLFHKRGALQYIAHLDLVRTVTKALVRAGVPLQYSEGFNPHPRIAFSTPMSIGLESRYELMDVRVSRPVDPAWFMEVFNRNMTPECAIDEAYLPTSKFTDILYSSYEMRILTQGAGEELANKCHTALHTAPVSVLKRSKSGEKEVDILPYIKESRVGFDGEALTLSCMLTADNAAFLNPEYLIKYLKKECGILSGSPLTEQYSILRTGLYTADGTLFR